ncbi:MAG TPA: TIGR00282 family metallophosphoesterase [Firmicutes bacterium]|nr:TIGR00282 family metallophosphoesterase [Candidatus Fermentithermobacillaceae bacterium]
MNILLIGDIVGEPGRNMLKRKLAEVVAEYSVDFVIANGENAAGGSGLTPEVAREILEAGVDVITSGNHIWSKKEVMSFLDSEPKVLRPLNYPPGAPGRGLGVFQSKNGYLVGVANAEGRVFSPVNLDCPFRALDEAVDELRRSTQVIIVDFHAEATSEKVAMGWYLDGRVTAVLGTHTHVQTADEMVLPGGTAYITDAGMTGSWEGVIGVRKDIILKRFLTQLPVRHEVARGRCRFNGVIVTESSGRARDIKRIHILEE